MLLTPDAVPPTSITAPPVVDAAVLVPARNTARPPSLVVASATTRLMLPDMPLPAPEEMYTLPPVPPPRVDWPADMYKFPPACVLDVPRTTLTEPLTPLVACPVTIDKAPEAPLLVSPVCNRMFPATHEVAHKCHPQISTTTANNNATQALTRRARGGQVLRADECITRGLGVDVNFGANSDTETHQSTRPR
jgi:hypothetical protein